jgi:hypothetical protein
MALAMEAVSTPEASIYSHGTARRNMPEVYHLHARCRENMKSYHYV